MRLDFAEIVAELIQPIAWGGDSVGGQDGVVDLPGSPTADRRAAVEQDLHEPDHACVVNLDAGKPGSSYRDRQRQTLQERELDVDVQALCLERGEAVGDRQEFLAHGGHVLQALLQAEIGQIVGTNLIPQEGGELFVLLEEGVFEVGPEDVMAVLNLLQGGVEFAFQLFGDAVAKDLRDLVGG
jgi:hypothetical protein